MPTLLADTHAHLADPALLPAVSELVANAEEVGVERILAVGIDVPSSAESVRLAERFPAVWAAVGIHPHEAAGYTEAALDEVRALAAHPKVVAIGEVGLDYFRDLTPPAVQQAAFVGQLSLAADLGLPVVVHNRAATADVLRMIGGVERSLDLAARAGVLHCFDGDVALGQAAIDLGFFISFAGNLTFRRADELRATAARLPLDWLLVETDSPSLAPVPFRGRTNQPSNVRLVAEKLAEVRGLPLDLIAAETSANAQRLFHWS